MFTFHSTNVFAYFFADIPINLFLTYPSTNIFKAIVTVLITKDIQKVSFPVQGNIPKYLKK